MRTTSVDGCTPCSWISRARHEFWDLWTTCSSWDRSTGTSRARKRPRLPIRAGQQLRIGGTTTQADIKVPGANKDFPNMKWVDRCKQQGAYTSSSGGLRKQGARLAVLAAKQIIDATPGAPASLEDVAIRRAENENGGSAVSIVWPDTTSPSTAEHPSVNDRDQAQDSVPAIASRARAYLAIDKLQQDLRQSIERYLLDRLPPEDVFGPEFDRLSRRQASTDVLQTGSLAQYLYPQEAYDVLRRNPAALPAELAGLIQQPRRARQLHSGTEPRD